MKLYHYHPQTKEYLSVSEAVKSPLEQDVYLIPSNATTLEPLEQQEDFAVCFDTEDGEWLYIDDHRGKTINNPQTKEEKICDLLGALEEGFVLGVYEKTLEDFKAEQIEAITSFKNSLKQFTLKGKSLWLDSEARSSFFNSITIAKLQNKDTIEYDGVDYPIIKAEQLLIAIHNYADSLERTRKTLVREIESLETIDFVKSFEYKDQFPKSPVFS